MKTIIFVCHGNICRSVAAEYIAKDYLKKINKSDEFKIFSCALTTEEIGNDIFPMMKEALRRGNIPFSKHEARLITNSDYDEANKIYYMDEENRYDLSNLFLDKENKISNITIYVSSLDEIEDPWYTRRFDLVVEKLQKCIQEIFKNI